MIGGNSYTVQGPMNDEYEFLFYSQKPFVKEGKPGRKTLVFNETKIRSLLLKRER